MGFDFSVAGNAWDREFYFTEDGAYQTLRVPAGGLLLAKLLESGGLSVASAVIPRVVAESSGVAPAVIPRVVAESSDEGSPAGIPGIRREHLTLSRVGDAWRPETPLGVTDGGSALRAEEADIVIVWDEGLDAFTIPAGGSVFWAAPKKLPAQEMIKDIKERTLLMISADVLRENGALISRQISWERSASELLWQIKNNPVFTYLRGIPEMIVVFAEDGAVHIKSDGERRSACLILPHGGYEGKTREESACNIEDAFALAVAVAAREWHDWIEDEERAPDIGAALGAAAELNRTGYPIEIFKSGDFGKLISGASPQSYSFNIPISDSREHADPDYWCATDAFSGMSIQDIAFKYVLNGAKVIDGIPRFSCGALTTIDRREIEAFRNIKGLITDYAASAGKKPLSIAVFGAPGSGKSFGVTQIANAVLPNKAQKLEFNISQMNGQEDLSAAFHRIRDVVLSGKLPIAFFDEFDSDRDGRALGWLKSFLMPMQDGLFRDGSGDHPVGKCIFVFAGGTASSFEIFCAPMSSAGAASAQAFKNAKGSDFVSRLRGTIDILGPNQSDVGERNYILRRALLLRSLLETKYGIRTGDIPISRDVLRAMLLVPRYKHGARSMEAVLNMSHIKGTSWEPSDLPFIAQLETHVDAAAFTRLVLRDVIFGAYKDLLAKTIHDDYLAKMVHTDYLQRQDARGANGKNCVSWEELDEDIRESNREQAMDIPKKLLSIQCSFDGGESPYATVESFTEAEHLRLAQEEHLRWMTQKVRDGWRYGPVRDDAAKIHHCLVDWDDLPDTEKEKDFDVARNLIPLLKQAGLRVYRMV